MRLTRLLRHRVLYIALHHGDPASSQLDFETTYTGYRRVKVKPALEFIDMDDECIANIATIRFPACTGGPESISYFSVGLKPRGDGRVLFAGRLDVPLVISNMMDVAFLPGSMRIARFW